MVLRLYNTLTKRKETFRPASGKEVRMYSCGPTVYSHAHIGNLRSFIFADVLRRFLEWKGWNVKHIMNITDVGHMTVDDTLESGGRDKIEQAAELEGKQPKDIADHYAMAFFEDIGRLNMRKAWFYPRATDHIGEMQGIISALIEKGFAYQRGGSVYYSVSKFKDYGKLSGNTIRKLKAGKRVAVVAEKKSPFDFALWIRNPMHVMQWPSPWGPGYPGWHIECTAMALEYLGNGFDLHTGGEDNIFPHHECEIAQAEGAGRKFARFWLHARHLLVDGKKMSKSLGNFYTLRDLQEKGYSPREVRFLLLSAHYRTKMNFTLKGLESAKEALQGLDELVHRLRGWERGSESKLLKGSLSGARKRFEKALDDDLNMSEALAAVFRLTSEVGRLMHSRGLSKRNARQALDFLLEADLVLGLDLENSSPVWLSADAAGPEVKELLLEREKLRKARHWKEADEIRDRLKGMGVEVEDTSKGPKWKMLEPT